MVEECKGFTTTLGLLKMMPLTLCKFVINTGLLNFLTPLWSGKYKKPTQEIISELTQDKDLRTIFCYCWGDYGTPPNRSHFIMQSTLNRHFQKTGAFYPVGGASEIAFNIIPVIEKSGGKVLVRVNVDEIMIENGQVAGVKVSKGNEKCEIRAPQVISSAGIYNTFKKLLPSPTAEKSYFSKLITELKPGLGVMNVFVGLNVSSDELNLKKQCTWAFPHNEAAFSADDYLAMSAEKAMDAKVPILFVSFPSIKDPQWKNHPGRENKTTCTIVTMANWEWFKRFEKTQLKKRGDDYEELKKTIGDQMVEQACQLFPQIRNHIDYVDIGSPMTQKHYLAQHHGEIYGLDHSKDRLGPMNIALLRPKTDIPGLFLTGQDILSCGFTGALMGGLLCSGAVLGRNTFGDLEAIHKELFKKEDKKNV